MFLFFFQTEKTKGQEIKFNSVHLKGEGYFSCMLGPAVPLLEFESKDPYMDNSGYAKIDTRFEMVIGHNLWNNLTVLASWGVTVNGVDLRNLENKMSQDSNGMNVGINSFGWAFTNIGIGTLLNLPVTNHFEINLITKIEFVGVLGQVYKYRMPDKTYEQSGSGADIGYSVGLQFARIVPINAYRSFNFFLETNYMQCSPVIKVKIDEPNIRDYSYVQPIDEIYICIGFAVDMPWKSLSFKRHSDI